MAWLSYRELLHDTVPEVGDEAEIWLRSAKCVATGKVVKLHEDGQIDFLVTSPLVMEIGFLDLEDFTGAVGDA